MMWTGGLRGQGTHLENPNHRSCSPDLPSFPPPHRAFSRQRAPASGSLPLLLPLLRGLRHISLTLVVWAQRGPLSLPHSTQGHWLCTGLRPKLRDSVLSTPSPQCLEECLSHSHHHEYLSKDEGPPFSQPGRGRGPLPTSPTSILGPSQRQNRLASCPFQDGQLTLVSKPLPTYPSGVSSEGCSIPAWGHRRQTGQSLQPPAVAHHSPPPGKPLKQWRSGNRSRCRQHLQDLSRREGELPGASDA